MSASPTCPMELQSGMKFRSRMGDQGTIIRKAKVGEQGAFNLLDDIDIRRGNLWWCKLNGEQKPLLMCFYGAFEGETKLYFYK